jgi:hypothetical protein
MPDYSETSVQTLSGRYFDLADPYGSEIVIEDIAGALGKICRFCGHTKDHYSVAQHSVIMSNQYDDEHLALIALLHDAHEAYTGDISSPFKRLLERLAPGVLASVEHDIADAIYREFGIDKWDESMWKAEDVRAYVTETRDQMRNLSSRDIEPYEDVIVPWDHATAEIKFLERFGDLIDQTGEW